MQNEEFDLYSSPNMLRVRTGLKDQVADGMSSRLGLDHMGKRPLKNVGVD